MLHYSNFNSVKGADAGSRNLPAGGYVAQIVSATFTQSRNGFPMLEIWLDIADGEYKGIFTAKATVPGMWNNAGIYRLTLPTDVNAPATDWRLQRLKGLITAVEESNSGFAWRDDERALKGQLVGVLYREEQFIGQQDGKLHSIAKPAFFCSVNRIRSGDFTVPRAKMLPENAMMEPAENTTYFNNDFRPVEAPINGDKDLPF